MQGMVLTLELQAFGKIHLGGNFTGFSLIAKRVGRTVCETVQEALLKISREIIITW